MQIKWMFSFLSPSAITETSEMTITGLNISVYRLIDQVAPGWKADRHLDERTLH